MLEPLRLAHEDAVLAFERDNRAYFATWISDPSDAFFEQFAARFRDSLAEQDAGDCAFHVLVEDDGSAIGRLNLCDLEDGSAKVGYRVARRARGIATAADRGLCEIASSLGLHALTAATSHGKGASQRVLITAGFGLAGNADPSEVGGRQGTRYQRNHGAD